MRRWRQNKRRKNRGQTYMCICPKTSHPHVIRPHVALELSPRHSHASPRAAGVPALANVPDEPTGGYNPAGRTVHDDRSVRMEGVAPRLRLKGPSLEAGPASATPACRSS